MNLSCSTLLNQARQNYIHGNMSHSLSLYKQLLEISRNDEEVQSIAFFEIAKIYTDLDKDDKALSFFKKSKSIAPSVFFKQMEWIENLKNRNKDHIFDEIQQIYSQSIKQSVSQNENTKKANISTHSNKDNSPDIISQEVVVSDMRNHEANGTDTNKYAGFWKRVVASLIDSIIIAFANMIIFLVIFFVFGISFATILGIQNENEAFTAGLFGIFASYFVWGIIVTILQWMYFALMESSRHQATLGKMMLRIYVTDLNGCRIGFGKATGRYFLKLFLCSFFLVGLIGCCMAAWTEKKQALHDMPVECLVLSK